MAPSLLLVAAGIAYNNVTGRAYPQRPAPAALPAPDPWTQRRSFTDADLDAVLARYNQVLDSQRRPAPGGHHHAIGRGAGARPASLKDRALRALGFFPE